MRRLLFVVTLSVAAAMTASRAEAQVSRGAGVPVSYAPPSVPITYSTPTVATYPPPGYTLPSYGTLRVNYSGVYPLPYSYYGSPYPLPARLYVGYGSNDFPFYGRPYGGPSTPWTWSAMSQVSPYPGSSNVIYPPW